MVCYQIFLGQKIVLKKTLKLKFFLFDHGFSLHSRFFTSSREYAIPQTESNMQKKMGKIGPLEYALHMQCPGVQNWSTKFWSQILISWIKIE